MKIILSETSYLLLADLLVLIHFFFIVMVVFGGVLVLKWHNLAWLHIPALLWGIFIEFTGRICPLTPLEIWFRLQAGVDIYSGGFISHYLVPVIYPTGLTQNIQWLLGSGLIVLNGVIYGYLYARRNSKIK